MGVRLGSFRYQGVTADVDTECLGLGEDPFGELPLLIGGSLGKHLDRFANVLGVVQRVGTGFGDPEEFRWDLFALGSMERSFTEEPLHE
jgi:hypothetical protein